MTRRAKAGRAAAGVALSVTVLGSAAALAPLASADTAEAVPTTDAAPLTTTDAPPVETTTEAAPVTTTGTTAATTTTDAPATTTGTTTTTAAATTIGTTTPPSSSAAAEEPVANFGVGKVRVAVVSRATGEPVVGATASITVTAPPSDTFPDGEQTVTCTIVDSGVCAPDPQDSTELIFPIGDGYLVVPGGTAVVTQTSAPDGFTVDPTVRTAPPCTEPTGGLPFCEPTDAVFVDATADARVLGVDLVSSVDGRPLAGAAFQLLQEGDVLDEATTDENGSLDFPGTYEPGDYTVHQVSASAGYLPSTTDQTLTVESTTPVPILRAADVSASDVSAAAVDPDAIVAQFANAADVPAPVAVADTATVARGGTLYVDVLANDQGRGADAQLDSFPQEPANGTIEPGLDPSCTAGPACREGIVYTPAAGFTGTDTFTYGIRTRGGTSTATVTVTVVAPVVVTPTMPAAQAAVVPAVRAGGLATTGVDALPLVVGGLALVGAGAAAVAGSRRGRHRAR